MSIKKYPPELGVLVDSHGHLCPGLAMGYRVSRYALKMVDKGPGLTVYSGSGGCPLHAIEVMTGCSRDNGTIIMVNQQGWAFYDEKSEEGFRFVLKNNLAGRKPEDKDDYINLLLSLPDNDLFDLEPFNPPGNGEENKG
ncbi:MAG: FmdE family protein [Bacillota bacterium]